MLRVEDASGHPCDFGSATREVTVNFPPVAEAGEAQYAATGQTRHARRRRQLRRRRQGRHPPLGHGRRDPISTARPSTHAYAEPGLYTATLTVTDDSGVANATATDTVTLTVNAPPVPAATGPDRPIAVGEIAAIDGSASTDADGAILSWSWDFGDGATGEGPQVQYAWAAPGVYPVTLTVTDDSATPSATTTTTIDVTVSAAPVADAGPDQSVAVSEVAFDGGGSSDADGRITRWDWDFGDGVTASGRTVRHAYARPGTYEVALVVRDDSGAPLNTAPRHHDACASTPPPSPTPAPTSSPRPARR